MRKAKQEFREVTDHCLIWLNREMVRDPRAMVAVSVVRRRYNEEAERAGQPMMTATQFGIAFTGAFPDIRKTRKGPRGNQIWFYTGIRLRAVPEFLGLRPKAVFR